MRTTKQIFALIVLSAGIVSCNSTSNEKTEPQVAKETQEVEQIANNINKDSLSQLIDSKRLEIESLKLEPIELSTNDLRGKIKQKWSKIHFYLSNDEIVRIKTYPHKGISERTEEFYADKSQLVLVVIEDNGSGEKGKLKDQIDKMYYFDNNVLMNEKTSGKEAEYNMKHSDSEELMAEFMEYVALYKQMKK